MTEKRYNSYCNNKDIKIWIDDDRLNEEVFHIYFAELEDATYCKSKLNPVIDLLNEQYDEIMDLRAENTKMKLVVEDIVADLEQQADTKEPVIISKAYANWIKENVDLRLHSEKDNEYKVKGYKSIEDKTLSELFDYMCSKYDMNGGNQDIVFVFKKKHPVNDDVMDLRLELR